MNHASVVKHESNLAYQHRSYVLGELDIRYFAALNIGGIVLGLNGYCLDALDVMPAGCMCHGQRWPAQLDVLRGLSLAEQQAREVHAEQIINEILAGAAQAHEK